MVKLLPTSNSSLPPCQGEFDTIAEGLDYAGRGETGCSFFSNRGALIDSLGYRDIRERAVELALAFDAAKLRRGERLAIIAETTPDFMIFFHACQYAGLVPVPLPLSVNLGGHETYVARLHKLLKRAKVVAATASIDLIGHLKEAAEGLGVRRLGTPEDFYALPRAGGDLRPLRKDEPCYLQYSSGSTSMPRGVLVTQRAITHNARAIGQHGLQLRYGDRATSWLPLYHDMGLVGFCLTPTLMQVTIDYLASTTFARRPMLWLKLLSENGGTTSFSPTFGYELCVRLASRVEPGQFDLSHWRVAGVGGEMVRPSVLNAFAERFADCGFDPRAFLPSYGLAESTLAVTFSPLGKGVRDDRVSREAYSRDAVALPAKENGSDESDQTRAFVKCGGPLPGHQVEVRDAHNDVLPERHIGRICIQGPSLMEGYFGDPEATRAAFTADGWLNTGDLGYMADGELVITGRSKDLIICNGRNIWPQDLEWAVESQCGVGPSHVAAFSVDGVDGKERVVILVECRVRAPEANAALRRQVSSVITAMAGVGGEVVLTPPRTLTFTSSGKLSRAAARADYLAGGIEDVGADLAAAAMPQTSVPLAAGAN